MNTFIRLAVLHACAAAAGAASHPHIDERATTLEFRPRSVVLSLAIGGISEPLVGHVRAQWLDPFDRIVATGAAKENLHTGQNSVVLAMPSPTAKLAADRHSDLVWHRIRWYVRIPAQGISSKGVLAVSELKSNLFTLQVLTPSEAAGLRGIPVLVRAVHPVSERPVAGVAVQASFKRSKGSEITAVTDSSGLARVTLHPPAVASDDESDDENIEIRARIGEFEQVATQAAEIDRHAEIRISTDKAIYQPGQTVRIRGIAMGPDGHVLPATTVQIAISAERRRKLMDITTTSSRYGIIAAEWTLPDNAETGRYSVEATIREGLFQGSRNWISVDVSRYELPHFTLQVTTDRSWYLPGQPAVVSVGASYLFGKPVHKGEVVITERLRPRWDAKRRESEQPEVQSGRTSLAAGRAEIRFTPRTPFGDGGYSAEIREYT
ncbi:MAG: hypothetical protein LC130_08960, partial [Bryobacterales bacterium]|nr:hypothetical protein [Bryobacterales bacterium]